MKRSQAGGSLVLCFLGVVLAGACFSPALPVLGAEGAGANESAKPRYRVFNGKLKQVDSTKIVLEGPKAQTFLITPETKISRDGTRTTWREILVGDKIGGRAKEVPGGKWEATTINAHQQPAAEGSGKAPKTKAR